MGPRCLLLAALALVVLLLACCALRRRGRREGFAADAERFTRALNSDPGVTLSELRAAAGPRVNAVNHRDGQEAARRRALDVPTAERLLA
jgi:hypothetical protein